MADKFDPYREALVVETNTLWPDETLQLGLPAAAQAEIERQLHADAAQAAQLEYVRLASGFCRQVTVTPADVARLRPAP
jgi:carbonic anhydrase/acetyltransferase-like protein (isoleucine patch superfamily)